MSTEIAAATTQGRNLINQFNFGFGVFQQNTAGVTNEEALRTPQPGGNCMNWVGGHLVNARNSLAGLLGVDIGVPMPAYDRYKRGSDPIDGDAPAQWDEIASLFASSHEKIVGALATMTEEQFAAPLPEDKNPFQLDSVGEMIATFAFHEAYHVGQLGVLRRVYGREGAIR